MADVDYACVPWYMTASHIRFLFGDTFSKSESLLSILIPLPVHGLMLLDGNVAWTDFPVLIGLDMLRAFVIVPYFR